MTNALDASISVPLEKWGRFFDEFSERNSGRHISIEILDPESGNQELIKDAPLMSIIYDRLDKGDNLLIKIGQDEMTYGHIINSPTEVLTLQDSHGIITSVSIADVIGLKNLIKLQVKIQGGDADS